MQLKHMICYKEIEICNKFLRVEAEVPDFETDRGLYAAAF